jgi:hypothetical protein
VDFATGDYALLKLNASARMDEYTGTLDYNTDKGCLQVGKTCTIVGWGQRQEGMHSLTPLHSALQTINPDQKIHEEFKLKKNVLSN